MVERELATLTLYPDTRLLSAVGDLVSNVAQSQGMPSDDALGMAKLTQRVLEYLFSVNLPISDKILITVSLYLRSGEFLVAIEHKGLPIELNGDSSGSVSPFSLSISSSAVDDVNLINLGKTGQRLELIKILPSSVYGEDHFGDPGLDMPKDISASEVPEDLEIRMIRPDEGLKLARCFYRVYGYTYGPSYVYFPDRLKSLIESGIIVSVGAFDSLGEIVAHGAMRLGTPGAYVGELISLAVDPKYRNSGLASKIHLKLMDYALSQSMKGLFGEAVTIHPYSQRLCVALGGKESAIMLGYIPPADYKKIADYGLNKRQMAIVYFFALEPSTETTRIFPPMNYRDIVKKIYSRLGLSRELGSETAVPWGIPCGETAFRLMVHGEIKVASITVEAYCPDTVKIIEFRLRELSKEGIEYVYLDLPLSDALTPYFAQELELIGFFFSGVIPHLIGGDALRLQFINTREVTFDSAIVDSVFGKELSKYVISKQHGV